MATAAFRYKVNVPVMLVRTSVASTGALRAPKLSCPAPRKMTGSLTNRETLAYVIYRP